MLDAGEPNKPGAAGKPNRHEFEVKLVDDDDVEVATGDTGEIVCRPTGPNLMFAGYWNRPDSTVEATRNLWFHTGDLARLDEDGYLYFVDRKKDALRRRGENISSFEMEKVLFGNDQIRDAAVHAVPSPIGEDDVKITVVLQDRADISEEDLCRWVAERVPYFAIPRYVEFRADLPRNPVGRVLKYQLRDEGVTPDDLGPRGRGRRLRAPLTRPRPARRGADCAGVHSCDPAVRPVTLRADTRLCANVTPVATCCSATMTPATTAVRRSRQ